MNKEKIRQFVENEIWENLLWENMEAVLFKDGDTWTRQEGSIAVDEENVIYTIPLSFSYWSESYAVERNENDEFIKDETIKEEFIDDTTDDIFNELNWI